MAIHKICVCLYPMDNVKQFIDNRPALKQSELAKAIKWAKSSFNDWMQDRRPIPLCKGIALTKLLTDKYGYDPEIEY